LLFLLVGIASALLAQPACNSDDHPAPAAGRGGTAGSSGRGGMGGRAGSSPAAGEGGVDAGAGGRVEPGGKAGEGGVAASAGAPVGTGGGGVTGSGEAGSDGSAGTETGSAAAGGTGGDGDAGASSSGGGAGAAGAAGAGAGAGCGRSGSAALVLGQTNFTSNTPASGAAGMTGPFAAAVDPTSGKVFVAEYVNNRVLRFPALVSLGNGAAAEAVLGQPDFATNDISTTTSRMRYPVAVAVDGAGRLWVADQGHNRVLRFDAAASKASGAAADGVLGQDTFTNAVPEANADSLDSPTGVAVDGAGRLFVADFNNHRVLRFDAAASKANGASADGVLGQPNFDSRTLATTQSGFYGPQSVALDSAGRLWVVDKNNSRIVRFDSAATKANGAAADAVLGQPTFDDRTERLAQDGMFGPIGVSVDAEGALWVADRGNHRLLCFADPAAKANGGLADGVLGQPSFTSGAAGTARDRFNEPMGIAIDGAGNLLVADYGNHRVLFFEP
jgi:sugar lactone lactonase YvrE